ncbi:L,D-transpeptidase [Aestuariivirga sp.]|uniref:L,D-transpeptidase n=1 Tax=Aestuariivirga sp. TaxID=2650926 RepID=UPI003BAC3718
MRLTKRQFLASGLFLALAGPALAARDNLDSDWVTGVIPDQPFNIDIVNQRKIPPQFRRQDVRFDGPEAPGTLVIDAKNRFLYNVTGPGRAVRYGIAVGREGAAWHGTAQVGRKAKWPTWTPTANMRQRNPKLPVQMKGGPENPLGARALYLYKDGKDTLYRIHGTNEPWSIGKAASSGCIRMLNEDVFELFGSVPVGTRVVVR